MHLDAAPPDDAARASGWPHGVGLLFLGIESMPIETPFGHTRVHASQSKGIDVFDRGCVATPEKRLGARSTRIFPLGFGGQTIGPAFLDAQPFAERHGIGPTHAGSNVLERLRAHIIGTELPVLFRRDLAHRHQKLVCEGDAMNGHFVFIAAFAGNGSLKRGRDRLRFAHRERPGGNSDEFHAHAVGMNLGGRPRPRAPHDGNDGEGVGKSSHDSLLRLMGATVSAPA